MTLPRRLRDLLPPAAPAPPSTDPATSDPPPDPTSTDLQREPHCWALACLRCMSPLHSAPVFGLSLLERAALEEGRRPPEWQCKCLGGRPGKIAHALVRIVPETPQEIPA